MLTNLLTECFREPAECAIKVGSGYEEITELYPFLLEVTIECNRSEATVATLKFETRRDEQGKWIVQDSGIFAPWEPIIIEAVFGSQCEEIMRGFIREIKAECPEEAGDTTVSVICQDESLQLNREHIRTVWGKDAPTDDRTIVSTILAKYGLQLDTNSGNGQSTLVLNQDDTDIRFLRARAEANGYELMFRKGQVYFGEMQLEGTSQSRIMVYAGSSTNCYRLSIKDDGHKPDTVAFDRPKTEGSGNIPEIVKPNLKELGPEPATSSNQGLEDFAWKMSQQGGMSEEEWKARAQKKANELSLKVAAEGELDGSLYGHVLQEGGTVEVDGLEDRYNGLYFVDSVKHKFTLEEYRQSFKLLRNAYGNNLQSLGTTGTMASVLGL